MRRFFFQLFLVEQPALVVLERLQRGALLGMVGMVLVSFLAANLQALLWQSSMWLVTTVLPAVVVERTNTEREAEAAAPLVRSALLDEAARRKAEHMVSEHYFAHYSPEGISPWHWFEEVGYTYAYAGENLAIHFSDSGEVVSAWMKSPTHRANIVNNNYTQIGVGTAKGTYQGFETVFVVQLFGTPAQKRALAPVVPTDPVAVAMTAPTTTATTSVLSMADQAIGGTTTNTGAAEAFAGGVVSEVASTSEAVVLASETTPRTPSEYEAAAALEIDAVKTEGALTSVYSGMVATTSGLPVLSQLPQENSGATKTVFLARLATQPNLFLQTTYMVLGTVVASMLILSLALSVRAHQLRPIAYSVALFLLMASLIALHVHLTAGALIV